MAPRAAKSSNVSGEIDYSGKLTITRVAGITGIKRRTLRSWIDKGSVPCTRAHPRLRVLDARFVKSVLNVRKTLGGNEQLLTTGEAADQVGVGRPTFYNYVLRGIQVPHLSQTNIARLVANCTCLAYDRTSRRLLVTPVRFVDNGYGYLDRGSADALRSLNHVVISGWVPINRFVDKLAKAGKRGLSTQDVRQLRQKVATLCARGNILSRRGLSTRHWYAEPRVAERGTLLFLIYRYRRLLIIASPRRPIVEAELRAALNQEVDLDKNMLRRAAMYSVAGHCIGFLYDETMNGLDPWKAEARSIPEYNLRRNGLKRALDELMDELRSQRRSFLPVCQVREEGPWKVLTSLCREKLRGRELQRTSR